MPEKNIEELREENKALKIENEEQGTLLDEAVSENEQLLKASAKGESRPTVKIGSKLYKVISPKVKIPGASAPVDLTDETVGQDITIVVGGKDKIVTIGKHLISIGSGALQEIEN